MSEFRAEVSEAELTSSWTELLPAENSNEFWNEFNFRLKLLKSNLSKLPTETTEIVEEVKKQKKYALELQRCKAEDNKFFPYIPMLFCFVRRCRASIAGAPPLRY